MLDLPNDNPDQIINYQSKPTNLIVHKIFKKLLALNDSLLIRIPLREKKNMLVKRSN
jgi:hypothetical protein